MNTMQLANNKRLMTFIIHLSWRMLQSFILPYFSKINGDSLTPNMCISLPNSNISNHIQNSVQVISQLTYHNNTLAKSTLIILLVKWQNISPKKRNSKKKKSVEKKIQKIQKHFIFNMKSSKLNNYSTNMPWSYPHEL
jgi:hypothetical protein